MSQDGPSEGQEHRAAPLRGLFHGNHPYTPHHTDALTAEIADPGAALHILQEEEKYVADGASDSVPSSSQTPIGGTDKLEAHVDEKEAGDEIQRTQSKASLAVMMSNFPDGGTRAYAVLMGATLVAFSTFGMTNSFGVYETYYAANQLSNKTPSDIAWIGSFQLFCMFIGGMVSGRIFDSYGPKWLLRVGSVMVVVTFFILPECKEYWQFFLCQGVLFGIGIATIFFPSIGCVNHYFLKKRAMAIGIMVGGSSLGGLVWPIVISQILNKIGFAWSSRIVALIILPLLVICNLLIKSRLPRRNPGPMVDFKYFKDPAFTSFSIGFFFILLGMFTPLWYIQTFAAELGVSPDNAFWLLAMINAGSLPGRVLPGFYADKIGSFNVLVPCATITAVLLFMWLVITTPTGIYIFAPLYGFFQGSMISLQASSMASICKDIREIGTMIGMGSAVCSIAGLTGTPIAGALLNADNGSWGAVVGFSGGTILLGTILAFIARMYLSKWKWLATV